MGPHDLESADALVRYTLKDARHEILSAAFLSTAFYVSVNTGLLCVVEWLATGEHFWSRGVYGMGLILVAMCLLPGLRRAAFMALRRLQLPLESSDLLKDGCFVLYLRNFRIDTELAEIDHLATQSRWSYWLGELFGYANRVADQAPREFQVIEILRRFGLVVAVGNELDDAPFPSGAVRYLLPHSDWKRIVARDMQRARLVLIVAGFGKNSGMAESTLWEYAQAVRTLPPERLLLLACGEEEHYERFRTAASAYLEQDRKYSAEGPQVPQLPDYPALRRPARLKGLPPLRGVISFDRDWTGHFTRFDPTCTSAVTWSGRNREMVRAQIDPFMEQVETRLRGTATRQRLIVPPLARAMVMVGVFLFGVALFGLFFNTAALFSQRIVIGVTTFLTMLGFMRQAVSAAQNNAEVEIEFPPEL